MVKLFIHLTVDQQKQREELVKKVEKVRAMLQVDLQDQFWHSHN